MARHLRGIDDLTTAEILTLTDPSVLTPRSCEPLHGTLAFLFEQPSLRTMSSFARAAVRVGLAPITLTATGEAPRNVCDFEDEIFQLGLTSNCVVARTAHRLRPALLENMRVPFVNAGDGSNEHPTQALVDIAALRAEGLSGKRVTLMGNLRDHRVHHSLVKGLQRLGARVQLLSPVGLAMGREYLDQPVPEYLGSCAQEVDEVLSRTDALYLTSVVHWNAPTAQAQGFDLDLARATRVLPTGAKILHPFPRHGELARDLDGTRFDAYHAQTRRAPLIRERMLKMLLAA